MTKLKPQSVEDGEAYPQESISERLESIRERRGDPTIASLTDTIAELKKDMASDKKANQQESFIQKQELVALRNSISTLQNTNAILAYKIDAISKKFADSNVSEHAPSNKDAKADQDDEGDFDGDSEEHSIVSDGEGIRQAQYDTLKELIEKNNDKIHMTIADNKKEIMTKLATKFQKRLDAVSSGLAEHVVHIEELKEAGNLVSIEDLRKQVNEISKVINNGPQSGFDLSEERNNEKTHFTNMDNFEALKQEVYCKFKLFAGEVDKELKRMNMKLGGLPVTPGNCEQMEAYLAHIESKMDNVQQWVMTVNQKLVDSGKANLVKGV